MKKLVVMAALVAFSATAAYAQGGAAGQKAAPPKKAAPTKSATGTVKSVTADSIVVTDKSGKEWTFTVDATTTVTAKGAGTKTAEAKETGKPGISITEAVKSGDRVTIRYHEAEGKMHAASVRVS